MLNGRAVGVRTLAAWPAGTRESYNFILAE
jgi:hypothetical protein